MKNAALLPGTRGPVLCCFPFRCGPSVDFHALRHLACPIALPAYKTQVPSGDCRMGFGAPHSGSGNAEIISRSTKLELRAQITTGMQIMGNCAKALALVLRDVLAKIQAARPALREMAEPPCVAGPALRVSAYAHRHFPHRVTDSNFGRFWGRARTRPWFCCCLAVWQNFRRHGPRCEKWRSLRVLRVLHCE